MIDDLTLYVGERQLVGWTEVRVTRGIERLPSDFEVGLTEIYPGEASEFVVKPGETCRVYLGDDLVISGYVDRYTPSIDAGAHSVRVSGRGKCADLVDCAAEWPGGQISGASVLGVAQKLAAPYGIAVRSVADQGPSIPQFNLNLGATPFEIVEQMCRYAALLAYEDTDGSLVLSGVSDIAAASGFVLGENVQSASYTNAIDQRYSEYVAFIQSMDSTGDLGDIGNLIATIEDKTVTRHRRRVIIAEAGDSNFKVAKDRALWECARRLGRSYQLRVVTDSWRDKDGKLWAPNTIVPLSLPALKIDKVSWTISEVTFKRDEAAGTTAELTIMPPDAFRPQPVLFQPAPADVPANPGAST